MNTTTSDTGNYTRALALIVGLWLLMRSVNSDATGRTLIDYILGNKASKSPYLSQSIPQQVGNTVSQTQRAAKGAMTNPFPGATGSRLDQGFDLTSKSFLAPVLSKIVYASSSVSGWAGGGLVAGKILSGPHAGMVWYMAEGIRPTVRVGQTVQPGQQVAAPATNPYNGIVGNIEAGWANPASPTQPLAQVSQNKPAIAWNFYDWIRSLGGPKATTTSNAGYP